MRCVYVKEKKTKELFSDFITNKKPNPEKKEEFCDFMIEKSGDENLLKRKNNDENVQEKKKKKKTKSYLDDLWLLIFFLSINKKTTPHLKENWVIFA